MNSILALGFLFLTGLLLARLGNRLRTPAVTAYLFLGILAGPSLLRIIPRELLNVSGLLSNVVLGLIAFGLGQNFTRRSFAEIGRPVLWISILEAAGAWVLVTLSLWLLGRVPFHIAFVFGAIASATAPAATVMVVREYKASGRFTNILLGVVAIDDAWALIIFAISLAISRAITLHASNALVLKAALHGLMEICGAFLLGSLCACLVSKFSRYLHTQTELLIYTLGSILMVVGLAIRLHLSVLLASMFLGAILINVDSSSFRFFDIVKNVDSPLYLLFFVLAGASLDVKLLASVGLLALLYILFRVAGKLIGSFLGGHLARVDKKTRNYLGLGLVPQAGVALGCALIARSDFPQYGSLILTTVLTTTVVYELIGPLCTRAALRKAGEVPA